MVPDDPKHENRMRRRELLKKVVSTGVVLALPVLAQDSEAAVAWVPAGQAAQFKPGIPKRVVLPDGKVVFVTRTSPQRLAALSARCTHQGCEVGWDAGGKRFLCPCHGATFSGAGRNLSGPARRSLEAVPVTQKGGQVLVNAAAASSRPTGRGEGKREEHEHEEHEEQDEGHERDDD
jgi:Rieske Fe-S protein